MKEDRIASTRELLLFHKYESYQNIVHQHLSKEEMEKNM
jgi:hypothetical protein